MNIHNELILLLAEMNIVVDENGEFIDLDSVEFIAMIIRVEETFGITFPDDLLMMPLVNSINKLEIIINNVLSGAE